jgi:hypothetical protein
LEEEVADDEAEAEEEVEVRTLVEAPFFRKSRGWSSQRSWRRTRILCP